MTRQRAMRTGQRELTARELEAVQRKHQAMADAMTTHGWRSAEHERARLALGAYLRELAGRGVPHSVLAGALGTHKSRPGQLMAAAERS